MAHTEIGPLVSIFDLHLRHTRGLLCQANNNLISLLLPPSPPPPQMRCRSRCLGQVRAGTAEEGEAGEGAAGVHEGTAGRVPGRRDAALPSPSHGHHSHRGLPAVRRSHRRSDDGHDGQRSVILTGFQWIPRTTLPAAAAAAGHQRGQQQHPPSVRGRHAPN